MPFNNLLRYTIQDGTRGSNKIQNRHEYIKRGDHRIDNGPIVLWNRSWIEYKTGAFKQVVCNDSMLEET